MGNQNHQHQVVKVRRETIEACMTCPLCNKLLRDATTISECLHTFCRKCIYQRISDEGLDSCPICNINLGCIPLEKLRPDHNLQDVRSKIFPYKRRKVEAPEVVESVTLPVIRRKERSLSSLVVSTPKVSTQTTTTGRRTKPFPRKAAALRGSGFSIEKPIKKEHDRAEDSPESSSSPETPKKFNQNTRQNSSSAEPSQPAPDDEAENGAEPRDGKSDLWQPLNFLVEVANRTKSFKSIPQVNDAKLESRPVRDNEPQVHKTKFKENKDKSKVKDEKNNIDNVSEGTVEPKRLRRIRRKKAAFNNVSGISSPAVLHTAAAKQERRNGPVWFSLLASEEQEGDAPLPQIPSSFLRLKDGNVPVSFIQKYLVKKLDLTSEVEVRCVDKLYVQIIFS
ncbi:E3 ubiquitin protein ligase DRIP2-like [Populus alba x Populus x berolinensis]|nr:E3 ubiquitin protein ligase DRIP2-like [Populus alba x Populus x berolinensis]